MIATEQELDQKLEALKLLYEEVEAAENILKALNTRYEELNQEIAQHFVTTGTQGKKVHGKNFILTSRTFTKLEDPVSFEAWVESNNAFKLLYARNANKLNAYCEEAIKNGEELPAGVTPGFTKQSITIRKG